jgi:proteasome lid subunit RPN8/RPN11
MPRDHFHTLDIPLSLYEAMLSQALAEKPLECCGLLAGIITAGEGEGLRVGEVNARYPLPNAASSPVEYRGDDLALLQAHKDMRQRDLELLAIYHSHPTTDAIPSRSDRERWYYGPEVVCLIISLSKDVPSVRGWWLPEGGPVEVAGITVAGVPLA